MLVSIVGRACRLAMTMPPSTAAAQPAAASRPPEPDSAIEKKLDGSQIKVHCELAEPLWLCRFTRLAFATTVVTTFRFWASVCSLELGEQQRVCASVMEGGWHDEPNAGRTSRPSVRHAAARSRHARCSSEGTRREHATTHDTSKSQPHEAPMEITRGEYMGKRSKPYPAFPNPVSAETSKGVLALLVPSRP